MEPKRSVLEEARYSAPSKIPKLDHSPSNDPIVPDDIDDPIAAQSLAAEANDTVQQAHNHVQMLCEKIKSLTQQLETQQRELRAEVLTLKGQLDKVTGDLKESMDNFSKMRREKGWAEYKLSIKEDALDWARGQLKEYEDNDKIIPNMQNFEEKVSKVKAEHGKKIEKMQTEHDAKVQKLNKTNEEQLAKADMKHQAALSQANTKWASKLEDLRTKMETKEKIGRRSVAIWGPNLQSR
jgi:chromosome segregation ATPase